MRHLAGIAGWWVGWVLWAASLTRNAALSSDCNANGIADETEVAEGAAPDCNRNGVPDACDLEPSVEFGPPRFVRTHADSPVGLIAVDLDRDGVIDLAVPETSFFLRYIGRGDGTFEEPIADPARIDAGELFAGPLDPRNLVVLVSGWDTSLMCVIFPSGNAFLKPGTLTRIADVADWNGDGLLDLVEVDDEYVRILAGTGGGSFEGAVFIPTLGSGAADAIVAELNGDGHPDLALTYSVTNEVSVLLTRADGSYRRARVYPTAVQPTRIVAVDADLDGDVDVATAHGRGDLSVLPNQGDGTFGDASTLHVGTELSALVAADMNGDRVQDLVTLDPLQEETIVLFGRGDGTFWPPRRVRSEFGMSWYLAVADFDGDGRQDLAVSSRERGFSVLLQSGARLPDPDCNANGVPDPCDIARGVSLDADSSGIPDECEAQGGMQLPGDCTQDGALDVSDAICVLGFLFLGDPVRLPCGDGTSAHPANAALIAGRDEGAVTIADAVAILDYLFRGGEWPPLPGPPAGTCVSIPECPAGPTCKGAAAR